MTPHENGRDERVCFLYTVDMNKFFAALILGTLLAPAFVAADSTYGVQPTLGQLLSRLAALQAMLESKPMGCVLATAPQAVTAGVPFTLAWGSYGTDEGAAPAGVSTWTNNGEQTLVISTPGKRKYEFDFYGTGAGKITCTLIVNVQ